MLPFCDDVSISRKRRAIENYAKTFEVGTIDNKSLSNSLFLSKNSIKSLFNDLLREKRGFKYILSTKIILKKHINNNETKYSTVYFNSITKTIINKRYHLNESFEQILNLLNICINESTGRPIDEIQRLYINTSNYKPLLGSSYIPLPKVLNNSRKSLINIKNKDHFMWCHVRLINPQNKNAERINKQDKKVAASLSYPDMNFH